MPERGTGDIVETVGVVDDLGDRLGILGAVVRCDSAGDTHALADACRVAEVGFSFGYPVDTRVQAAVEILNESDGWYPAIESSGGIRDGAWVAVQVLPPVTWLCK
jgi:hypothetical protein